MSIVYNVLMWNFLVSATKESNWPNQHGKEVCFIGRSNVGKSSLINALAKAKVARTSNTPGRTQLINFFVDEGNRHYVDLPGYGYAKMPKKVQNEMLTMLEDYLQGRKQLIKVYVLIDAKVGPTKDDILIINFLKEIEKPFMIIMTKGDKPNQSLLYKSTLKVKEIVDDYLVVSALKRKNIAKLDKIIKIGL